MAPLDEATSMVMVGDTEVVVHKGDITKLDVDAIVNAANSMLTMGGGVAAAIKRKGGKEIEEEAMKKAPIPVGKAVYTNAGRLKAKYVIHAPTMKEPGPTSSTNVYKATKAALECCERLGIVSLAMPGMGTGVGDVPPKDAAEAMIRAIGEQLAKGSSLKRIVLVDISEEMVRAFSMALKGLREGR